VLAGIALIGTLGGLALWPRRDPEALPHTHDDLPQDHPHQAEHRATRGHAFV